MKLQLQVPLEPAQKLLQQLNKLLKKQILYHLFQVNITL